MMAAFGMFKGVTKGQVARYMLTPQIGPRLNSFYRDGFSTLAYLVALVYRAVNILPEGHFALRRENRAHLGIREVMAAAAAEIKFTRRNIDQIIIYFAIMLGMALLVGQFFLTLGYLMINPAMASMVSMPTNYGDFFAPHTDKDVAYRLLFTVFGVPDLFSVGSMTARSAYHTALHSLFQLYSVGLLVVAAIIVCYFIFAIVVETAQTGVPFGKRYNHVWAPIRLVFALGLLIPIGYGLNASQWITLYSAKFGSDFATRGWNIFNQAMNEDMLNNPEQRVGRPQAPEMMNLMAFMMTTLTCKHLYNDLYKGSGAQSGQAMQIMAYLVKNPAEGEGVPISSGSAGFTEAQKYFANGDIVIRFGEHNPDVHTKERGHVYPYCGELIIMASDANPQNQDGAFSIQQYYFSLVEKIFNSNAFGIDTQAENFAKKYKSYLGDPSTPMPEPTFKSTLNKQVSEEVEQQITQAVTLQGQSQEWKNGLEEIRNLGWGGAGLWYNKIAQINGALANSVAATPQIRTMPAVMEYVKLKQLQQNQDNPQPHDLTLADQKAIQFDTELDRDVANVLSYLLQYWTKEDTDQGELGTQTRRTNNIFVDVINSIFGTKGLFDMCKSADVHPLAQLATLGKGLIEASIRNIAGGTALSALSMINVPFLGVAAGAAGSILLSVATVTLSMGFLLFYVIPFMPFLYFFFAVGSWIKSIFEAMVGAPLWALAHLRIDGEDLPGDAAMRGIYMIFEIFLRPILVIFGLLASFVIFSAMVKILNEIFSLVVVNLAGHDPTATSVCGRGTGSTALGTNETAMNFFRGPIDELFFTVIYAIIVYMIGMSCFKLIDLIPNNLLRYMGTDTKSFSDQAIDPTENMMRNLGVGAMQVSGTVINKVGGGAAGAVSNTMRAVMPKSPPGSN